MKTRVSTVLLIVCGSFCVYCVQNGTQQMDVVGRAAGPVAPAVAQSNPECPVPGPAMLFDEAVSPTSVNGRCLSREIDISRYRMVVVHRTLTDGFTELKLGDAAGFVPFLPVAAIPNIQVIDPQLGRVMRFSWSGGLSGVCGTRAFTVVGYNDAGRPVLTPPAPAAMDRDDDGTALHHGTLGVR